MLNLHVPHGVEKNNAMVWIPHSRTNTLFTLGLMLVSAS